jgi:hypothetical protein
MLMSNSESAPVGPSQEDQNALPVVFTRIEIPPEDPAVVRQRDNICPDHVGAGRPMQAYRVTVTDGRYEPDITTHGKKAPSGEAATAISEGLDPESEE